MTCWEYAPKHASWLNMGEIEIGISAASAWTGASTAGSSCAARSMPDSKRETRYSEPSSGPSLDRTQIISWAALRS